MNVAKYLFQSPYNSPVQVGRLDPSSKQDDSSVDASSQQFTQNSTKTQPEFKLDSATTETTQTTSTTNESQLLDLYV
jgi:hypothetical protein